MITTNDPYDHGATCWSKFSCPEGHQISYLFDYFWVHAAKTGCSMDAVFVVKVKNLAKKLEVWSLELILGLSHKLWAISLMS